MDCSGCRAYVLEQRASAILSRGYGLTAMQAHKEHLAAALLARAEQTCYNLRASGCCPVNPKACQIMATLPEAAPATWPVFQPVAIPHQVGSDD